MSFKFRYMLFLLLIFLIGCSTGKVKIIPAKGYIFYPPLPNSPRYQYLTSFSTSRDIVKKKSKFFSFVAGKESEKAIPIRKPYGIEADRGIIYVCDIRGDCVVTLDLQNRKFGRIGLSGPGKLNKPVNLKLDLPNNRMYVADMGRKQVVVFSLKKGNYLKAYGKLKQFTPSDVDISGGKLYICDVKQHTVFVLDIQSGRMLYKIGKAGSKPGELFHPTNICIRGDKLYVSDTTNFRIQVFTLQGRFLSTFGKIGRRPGDFSRGKGIAVDHRDRIYVVDAAFQKVQVFNRDFKLLLFMFGPGGEKHNINLPAGITLDYNNIPYFKQYLSPKFKAEYLLMVTSNFGRGKVNVYAFGTYQK